MPKVQETVTAREDDGRGVILLGLLLLVAGLIAMGVFVWLLLPERHPYTVAKICRSGDVIYRGDDGSLTLGSFGHPRVESTEVCE